MLDAKKFLVTSLTRLCGQISQMLLVSILLKPFLPRVCQELSEKQDQIMRVISVDIFVIWNDEGRR